MKREPTRIWVYADWDFMEEVQLKGFMPPRPSGHLALGSPPFELKSPDEYLLLTRDDQPKTKDVEAVGGFDEAAARRPATPAAVVPAAPTKHPIRPRSRTGGIVLGNS